MTRKDFELIAKVLRESEGFVIDDLAVEGLAHMFADALADTNAAFNRELFIAKATATQTRRAELRDLIGAN